MADVVMGQASAEERIVSTSKAKTLNLLLGGQSVRSSADLCSSDGMAALITWAKEHYDYVLIDTPPMSAGVDAECLSELSDASAIPMGPSTLTAVLTELRL